MNEKQKGTATMWPEYMFADLVGPEDDWFAWYPVRLWWGRWVWFKSIKRRSAVVHSHLDPNGGDMFWCYR